MSEKADTFSVKSGGEAMSKYEVYDRIIQNNSLEDYKAYCLFNLRHHRHYKPFNCALIMAQRPGAKYVQTERAWKREGYEVKPEAIPIVIMQVNGPVTLVYDREDVYETKAQLRLIDEEEMLREDKRKVEEEEYAGWVRQVIKSGIRVAESRFGERMGGKAENLLSPIQLHYTETENGQFRDKAVMAYHQITLSSELSTHEKALTLLHELGHLYCGHIPGERTNANGLPEYREISTELTKLRGQMTEAAQRMKEIEGEKGNEAEYRALEVRCKELRGAERAIMREEGDKKEYEAQLVCKLLCERNSLEDNKSDNYLYSHARDGKMPEISITTVMEAIEKIAAKLDI